MGDSSVAAFPLYRRRQLVTGIARVLGSKHGEEANLFWRATAKELLCQLAASGVAAPAAEEEVRTLLSVVLMEMQNHGSSASG